MSAWVRWSFWLFAAALLFSSVALIIQRPNVFFWKLSPENSTLYGWIFLGNMFYFLYGLRYSVMGNARGQLIAFLAYDLVLIFPFIAHFSAVSPTLLVNLTAYVAVVGYSGLLALAFLFVPGFGPIRHAKA